jgi:hypothetical protein
VLCDSCVVRGRLSQRRFTVLQDQHIVLINRCQYVVLRLKPYELGLKVPYTPLETSHLCDDPGVGTADVAK